MESREDLNKFIQGVNQVLVNDRLKLDQNVFLERHLPTIIKNGNLPTKELQAELVKIAGGEIKVIDLIDESGKTVISLPPAIGSSKTIPNSSTGKLSNINRTFSDIAEAMSIGNIESAQIKLSKTLKENKQEIIKTISENPWDKVVDFYKDKVKTVNTPQTKKQKENITFDYS